MLRVDRTRVTGLVREFLRRECLLPTMIHWAMECQGFLRPLRGLAFVMGGFSPGLRLGLPSHARCAGSPLHSLAFPTLRPVAPAARADHRIHSRSRGLRPVAPDARAG